MKIFYASRAFRATSTIFLRNISKRSPQGARSVSPAIEHAIRMCAINPHASGMTDEPGVYRRPLGQISLHDLLSRSRG
jgi:hypothetical protein